MYICLIAKVIEMSICVILKVIEMYKRLVPEGIELRQRPGAHVFEFRRPGVDAFFVRRGFSPFSDKKKDRRGSVRTRLAIRGVPKSRVSRVRGES